MFVSQPVTNGMALKSRVKLVIGCPVRFAAKKHPNGGAGKGLTPASPQVPAKSETENGTPRSTGWSMHSVFVISHVGSRTWAWKPCAWLATDPKSRTITNRHTTRKHFILYSSKGGRGGAEKVHSKIVFGRIQVEKPAKQRFKSVYAAVEARYGPKEILENQRFSWN
jgi:hypothetical protein